MSDYIFDLKHIPKYYKGIRIDVSLVDIGKIIGSIWCNCAKLCCPVQALQG
jgi:hypothetical protein